MSKSVLMPTQVVRFLGVILDSVRMTVSLHECNVRWVSDIGRSLLGQHVSSVQDLASH